MEVPASWTESKVGLDVSIDDIIMKAKPVEALSKIHANSWLATKRNEWKLDGM